MNVERRPGEAREAWRARVRRQRVDDQEPGSLAQFFYDLTVRISTRILRFARRGDRDLPELEQPETKE